MERSTCCWIVNGSSKMATSHVDSLKKTATRMASTSAALEGLPKQFVVAMKTLFEVMDDRKSGYVKLSGLNVVELVGSF